MCGGMGHGTKLPTTIYAERILCARGEIEVAI